VLLSELIPTCTMSDHHDLEIDEAGTGMVVRSVPDHHSTAGLERSGTSQPRRGTGLSS
jgi:hypothetical protein